MSNFKITGTVTAVAEIKSGNGKSEWKSTTITVRENEGKFPNEVSLGYMKSGENINFFAPPKVGDSVEVEFTVRQREYNGKKYNDLSVWTLKNNSKQAAQPEQLPVVAPAQPSNDDDGFPF